MSKEEIKRLNLQCIDKCVREGGCFRCAEALRAKEAQAIVNRVLSHDQTPTEQLEALANLPPNELRTVLLSLFLGRI